ncbi:hypothetical protein IKF92_00440 [Candidatus Saccharibacteria bacterium]|nr:hypothetical protein [Candidatus Saccharibacteria bacterium]
MEKINNSLSSFASGEEKDEKLTKDDKYDIPVRFSDENLPDDWEEVGIRMSNVSEKKAEKASNDLEEPNTKLPDNSENLSQRRMPNMQLPKRQKTSRERWEEMRGGYISDFKNRANFFDKDLPGDVLKDPYEKPVEETQKEPVVEVPDLTPDQYEKKDLPSEIWDEYHKYDKDLRGKETDPEAKKEIFAKIGQRAYETMKEFEDRKKTEETLKKKIEDGGIDSLSAREIADNYDFLQSKYSFSITLKELLDKYDKEKEGKKKYQSLPPVFE